MPSALGPGAGRTDTYTGSAVRGDGLLRRLAFGAATIAAAAAVPVAASASTSQTLHLGESVTVTGHAGSTHGRQATGQVVVRGQWGSEQAVFVTTTRTDQSGNYTFKVKPNRRGVFTLQITPPDHQRQLVVLHII